MNKLVPALHVDFKPSDEEKKFADMRWNLELAETVLGLMPN